MEVMKGTLAAVGAFLSAKLGILFPVLCILLFLQVVDYISGLLGSYYAGIKITSKLGFKGIIKKFGYWIMVTLAICLDWLIINVAAKAGIEVPATLYICLLISLWLILNEALSILENLAKMENKLPSFLLAIVQKFQGLIENKGNEFSNNLGSKEEK